MQHRDLPCGLSLCIPQATPGLASQLDVQSQVTPRYCHRAPPRCVNKAWLFATVVHVNPAIGAFLLSDRVLSARDHSSLDLGQASRADKTLSVRRKKRPRTDGEHLFGRTPGGGPWRTVRPASISSAGPADVANSESAACGWKWAVGRRIPRRSFRTRRSTRPARMIR